MVILGNHAHLLLDDETPSVSSGIEKLRQLLQIGKDAAADSVGIYAQAAKGSLPVVVQAFNEVSYFHISAPLILCESTDPATPGRYCAIGSDQA